MKKTGFVRLIHILFIIGASTVFADQQLPPASHPAASNKAPAVVVKEPDFQFAPVVEGHVVTHEYIIQNAGNAPLHIEKVKTSCGCTTADYTKIIPPNSDGKIAINGNTAGYGGSRFHKTITVQTDDPKQKELRLHISGDVERFAVIEPRRVFLQGVVGDSLQSVITITPERKYPFTITTFDSGNLEDKIRLALRQKDGKFILTVDGSVEIPGRYWGNIHLKTDSPVQPEIVIPVMVLIKSGQA